MHSFGACRMQQTVRGCFSIAAQVMHRVFNAIA